MFSDLIQDTSFENGIYKVKNQDIKNVEKALSKSLQKKILDFEDYLALISPSALNYLKEMASLSRNTTRMRFGNTIQLFMPLYLSNECRSSCLYCGFSYENKIPRKTLNFDELKSEAKTLKKKGIQHILILTGEEYKNTSVSYIQKCIEILRDFFVSISIEIYPLYTEPYKKLIQSGASSLILYQETYDKKSYEKFHIRGMKKNMKYRLDGPDRGGLAGFRKIGLGVLFGLANPLGELFFLGKHVFYLTKKYWKTSLQVSFPRIKKAESNFTSVFEINDKQLLQYICAMRICFPEIELVLSTRERAYLRDNFIDLGITQISVESKTEPGGYSNSKELKQFEIDDKRSIAELVQMIKSKNLEPVYKDFDLSLA